MNSGTPRIRMFAGPNGSGKSTLKHLLKPGLLGIYVNADDIEAQWRTTGQIDLSKYQVTTTASEIEPLLKDSPLIGNSHPAIRFTDGILHLSNLPSFSYHASIVADFVRRKLLEQGVSFSFETVMSHLSKVDFLSEAQLKGYRTYLYYVATIDPSINVSRVKLRVRQGGHDVPEAKIRSRYVKSLSLLMDAIQASNRAYVFDNSVDGQDSIWLAEVTEGADITLKSTTIPAWFQHAVWNKLPAQQPTPPNPQ